MKYEQKNKRMFFNESWDTYFKLRNIGYHDFRTLESTKIARVHNWVSLHFVVRGKGKLLIRDKEYNIGSGDFFYIPPNEPTVYYADNSDPWRYYWISFSTSSLFRIADALNLSADSPTCKAKKPLRTSELFQELFNSDATSTELCYLTFSALMNILATEATHPPSPTKSVSRKKTAETIRQLIDLNYTNPNFSTQEISHILYLSTRQIDRIFKSEMQMTPRMYLINARLNHATELLKHSDYKIRDLCNLVGFYDELQFMKIFKSKFGLTVKEYRKTVIDTEQTKKLR